MASTSNKDRSGSQEGLKELTVQWGQGMGSLTMLDSITVRPYHGDCGGRELPEKWVTHKPGNAVAARINYFRATDLHLFMK